MKDNVLLVFQVISFVLALHLSNETWEYADVATGACVGLFMACSDIRWKE